MKQKPEAFEFNHFFLQELSESVNSCRFGTFLCNSEFERDKLKINQRTLSLWSFMVLSVFSSSFFSFLLFFFFSSLFSFFSFYYGSK